MKLMFGYLRRMPLRTRRCAARVVSSRKSAANGATPGTVGPGRSAGWMNTTAERPFNAAQRSSCPSLSEVGAGVIGQQHDAVGLQLVERSYRFGDRFTDGRHRDGGEETEPVWLIRDQLGRIVVQITGQRGGVRHVRTKRGSGCGHRQN